MLDLEQIQKEARGDLHFEMKDVDTYAIRLASLREKYVSKLIESELIVKRLESELSEIYATKFREYMFERPERIDRRDVDGLIFGDPEYSRRKLKLDYSKQISKYVDGVLSSIDSAKYNIGNAVKWAIFKAGG